MSSESFRPRLPLDPFTAIDHDIPWSIPQYISLSHPQTILILGEPTIHDLLPLLTSAHISNSLVLIATSAPPLIPANSRGPALRILRLAHPLAAHNAGALRLVSLLERAQRVAHLWPRDSTSHTIQLAQPYPTGDFSIVETVSYAHPTQESASRRYPSPAPSISESVSSPKWRSGLSPHKKVKPADVKVPFDAIINFLPRRLPDKALLKHAILVTTLSAQFLTPPATKVDCKSNSSDSSTNRHSTSSPSKSHSSTSFPSSGSTSDTSPCPSPPPQRFSKLAASSVKNRLSLLLRTTPPPPSEVSPVHQGVEASHKVKNAHLVHVLPLDWSPDSSAESDAHDRLASTSSSPLRLAHHNGGTCKPRLVQSIEQFLLTFAYPLVSLVSSGSACSGLNLSSPSSNLKQRPKSVRALPSTYETEHAFLRASTLPTLPSTNAPLTRPAPYLLAPGVFASCVSGSRCSLPHEDGPEHLDARDDGNAYTDPDVTALTIGEIILLGALDFDHMRPETGNGNGRAWIGDVNDVVVVGGSSDPDSSSRRKGKGREVAIVNTKMLKTITSFDGLPTPPESNNSTEGAEDEQENDISESVRTSISHSSPSHEDSTPSTRSKASKRESASSSISFLPPTFASTILNLKLRNNASDKVKDKKLNRFSDSVCFSTSQTSPVLPSPVQLPPLVIHRDRARSPRGSEDSYDLGFGHGVPVPPMIVPTTPGSRSASGSGLGSPTIPLQTQGDDAPRSLYGGTPSPKKGSERKDLIGTLRKMGLWRSNNVKSVGLKA